MSAILMRLPLTWLALIRTQPHHFGRLGFTDYVGVFPSIIPINYLLDEDKIVIRTDAGSRLNAALRGAPVAFEVDGVDETHQVGWSVLVRGRAEEVTDEDKLAELRQTPLLAWHPGPKPRYVVGIALLGEASVSGYCSHCLLRST
jgi:nitroimidazol reductase NimA-like FMN-containing flavoprotein (pyridoxamine 5'-phosphate oxidase superfamily)